MRQAIITWTVLLCSPGLGSATPMIYQDTAIGSGSLGANSFSGVLITVTYSGDTTNIFGSGGFFAEPGGIGTVSVIGLGTATFTDSMEAGAIQGGGGLGFIQDITMNAGVLGTIDGAFTTYDLSTPIGPVTGASLLHAGSASNVAFNTTLGAFMINSAGSSTFTAMVPAPEPAAAFLVGVGVAGIAMRKLSNFHSRK